MRKRIFSSIIVPTLAVMLMMVGTIAPSFIRPVRAAQCNTIAECNQKIDENNNAVAGLQQQALSYQDAINHLNAQIYELQGAINNNIARQTDLQNQIQEAQRQLDEQKAGLSADIRNMYVDGQPTTIEMLASSNNLSDFFDKETYRVEVQNKIQSSLKKIAELQKQLADQKTQIDQLLAEEATQKSQLDGARAQQAGMLAYNQSQQSSYNAQTAANQARLQQLIEEQRRANGSNASYYFLRFAGNVAPHNPSVDDYPYANGGFGMSTAPGCVDNDGPDQWGYCTRQCVSYAAWAVERSGRAAPRYYGNAKDWVGAARRAGVAVYTANPKPGDVAISTAGTWGHAMYVEQVDGNRIFVSEYNNFLTGRYYTEWRTWY